MKISQQQQQQQQGRKTESCASSLLHIWIFLAPLREINVLLFLPLCSVVDKYRSSCAFLHAAAWSVVTRGFTEGNKGSRNELCPAAVWGPNTE